MFSILHIPKILKTQKSRKSCRLDKESRMKTKIQLKDLKKILVRGLSVTRDNNFRIGIFMQRWSTERIKIQWFGDDKSPYRNWFVGNSPALGSEPADQRRFSTLK